jgi:hypothetical protein
MIPYRFLVFDFFQFQRSHQHSVSISRIHFDDAIENIFVIVVCGQEEFR